MAGLPFPHRKQRDFMKSYQRFKLLLWGRRCFAPNTLVATPEGYVEIKDLKPGDKVLSLYEGSTQPKEVLANRYYGAMQFPKPMLKLTVNGKEIVTTYDHEFYYQGEYVPVYLLAWGTMATADKEKLKVLCQQYGTLTDNELQRWAQDPSNETSIGQERIPSHGGKRQDDKDAPNSGADLAEESSLKRGGEPHQRSEARQLDSKPGMGDQSRKLSARPSEQLNITQPRGEVRNPQADGEGSVGDTSLPTSQPTDEDNRPGESISALVPDKNGLNKGYTSWEELAVSSVELIESQESYDLSVEDDANYLITEDDILVHNSGKSMGIAMYTMLKAIEKQGNYYIIAPTYKQAKSIYWRDILKIMVPNAIIKKTDEGELYIQFEPVEYNLETSNIIGYDIHSKHDPSKPLSTIYLKGAADPDSLRGVALDGAVMDESAFYPDAAYIWNNIIRPALADREGWGVWTSTPNGTNDEFYVKTQHAIKSMNNGGDWFYSHATALDNPYFPENEWTLTKTEYETTGREDQWMQEWEAQFVNPSKLIYKEFSDDIHVIHDPLLIPRTGTYAVAMDFGFVDPFAAVFVVIDEQDNWYVYDEIYQPGLTIDEIAARLRTKMGDNYHTRIIGDAAGATEIASLRKERIWVTKSKKGKDSIKAGIRLVSQGLHPSPVTGRPKLYVSAKCVNLINEFKTYSRLVDAWGETSETPEDKNNHLMDAIRYLYLDKDKTGAAVPKAVPLYDPSGRRLD